MGLLLPSQNDSDASSVSGESGACCCCDRGCSAAVAAALAAAAGAGAGAGPVSSCLLWSGEVHPRTIDTRLMSALPLLPLPAAPSVARMLAGSAALIAAANLLLSA